MKQRYLIFLFVIFLLSACKENEKEENINEDFTNVIQDTVLNTTKGNEVQSIDLRGKYVVYFIPSPKEQKELKQFYGNVAQWEFQSMFRNMENLARFSRRALKAYGINTLLTYAKIFNIELDSQKVVIDLRKEDQIMGFLLVKEDNYKIFYGVYSKKSLIKEINDFFGIKFRFNYTPVNIQRKDEVEETAAP